MKVMIFNHLIMMILMLATFMQACSFAPTKKPEGWPSAKKAIRIELHADKNLNVYEGSAHTVPVCVYQLIRPDFFNKLASYPEGLNRLLECRQFHPSVTRIYRLTMLPNEKKKIDLDRDKGVKHVAVTAGYFFKDHNKITRIFQIPIRAERPALIKSTEIVRPAPLDIQLDLGPEQIR